MKIATACASLVCAMWLVGCDKTSETKAPPGPAQPAAASHATSSQPVAPASRPAATMLKPTTPQVAIKNLLNAVADGNKDRFMACWAGTPQQVAAMGSMYEAGRASADFRERFIKAYGDKSWDDFEHGKNEGARARLLLMDEGAGDIDKAHCKINGRTAELTDPDHPSKSFTFLKVGDEWRLDASGARPPDPRTFAELMDSMTASIQKYGKAIGKKGIKPEDINFELGRAMAESMMGVTMKDPHRFDIDNLPAD